MAGVQLLAGMMVSWAGRWVVHGPEGSTGALAGP